MTTQELSIWLGSLRHQVRQVTLRGWDDGIEAALRQLEVTVVLAEQEAELHATETRES